MLAAEIGEQNETVERLNAYAAEAPTTETLVSLERVLVWNALLPNLKSSDIAFVYKTNLKDETKTLRNGEELRLELTPEEAATLRFRDVKGDAGVAVSYDAPLTKVTPDMRISVSRRYTVGGVETKTFKDGDVVKISLSRTYNAKVPGLYTITDYLPSGLRPVVKTYSVYYNNGQSPNCIRWPVMNTNQSVTFMDWSGSISHCNEYYYFARVVSRGIYIAEPAIVQSMREPTLMNLSASANITIK